MSNRQLAGKVAMITGAGSGIGRATAVLMAERGASVMVADIDDAAAMTVVGEIHAAGGIAEAVHVDICHEDQIKAAVAATVSHFGRIDIMHNNAAYAPGDVLAEDIDIVTISTDAWDRVMQGTLRGTMLGCRYAVIEMLRSGGGSIINTSSMYGLNAFNRMPAYSVSKAAINLLTEHVATAFGRGGIRCNAVAPSMIRTPMLERAIPAAFIEMNVDATLTGFLGEPSDVAAMVAFLASDEARYITGQIMRVDGGSTAHLATYADARRFFDGAAAPG
jgi:NAD(P)-dependent dehydrogenase (short-subunit alcohol dehydrogenase family)